MPEVGVPESVAVSVICVEVEIVTVPLTTVNELKLIEVTGGTMSVG